MITVLRLRATCTLLCVASGALLGMLACDSPTISRTMRSKDIEPVRAHAAHTERDGRGKEATGAVEMARQRYEARLGNDGTIPPNALWTARQQADEVPTLSPPDGITRDAGIWNWEWLGPGNIGGRIRTIAVHPSNPGTIFVGAASGGIWKTTNAGGSWTPINDFLASLAVTSLIYDPTNVNTMYAGTGEGIVGGGNSSTPGGGYRAGGTVPGAGVFVSTDAGATWDQDPNTPAWRSVNRLAHHLSEPDVVFAATSANGLQRSAPDGLGGRVWTPVLTTAVNLTDVEIDPTNPSLIVVGGIGGAWISTTDGDPGSFTPLSTGLPNALPATGNRYEFDFGADGTIWASINRNGGEIWRSTDGGNIWLLINTGTNYLCNPLNLTICQGDYDNVIWASPDDPDLLVVGGIDLFRSTNGGASLQRISNWVFYHNGVFSLSAHADQHFIAEPVDYGPANRALYFGNDGGIQRANNIYSVSEVLGWTNLANGLGITQFYAAAAAPDGSVVIGGAQDNGNSRYRPSDGVHNWLQCGDCTGDGGFCAVDSSNPNVMYTTIQNLSVWKSIDGGGTYFPATNGLTDSGDSSRTAFIAPLVMAPSSPSILAAGGRSIWYTVNGAGVWNSIRGPITGNPLCSAIDIQASNPQNIWVGYRDGRVSRTTVSVTNWVNVDDNDDPNVPDRWVTDIAISPTDSDEVFVTFGGYLRDTVWFTPDNGATWLPRHSNLPPVHINSVAWHPNKPGWTYVGTELGVFASEDRGLTWNRTPRFGDVGHDGPVNTETSHLFWQGDYLMAATFGRGVYRTRPLDIVYVDKTNIVPGCEDGSLACPYNTLREGLAAQGHGTDLSIAPNDYNEGGPGNPVILLKRGEVVASGAGPVVIR